MYELIIVWDNGDKDIYTYNTQEEAERGADNMRMAFGNQVTWAGTRKAI